MARPTRRRLVAGVVLAVRLYNPATGLTTVALTRQLDARFEDGRGRQHGHPVEQPPRRSSGISVDLGSVANISRVRLQSEAAYGRAYQIQTSTNNSTWTTISSTTTSDGG
jgi:hypothetical protein